MRSFVRVLAAAVGLTLFTGCSPQFVNGLPGPSAPVRSFREDSVVMARQLVYAYVRAVDRYGRPRGELPSSLEPVVERGEAGPNIDLWGRALRYQPNGLRFEVRSAGADREFDTRDDIIALGQLGRNQPCEIRDEFRVWTGVGFEPPCAADAPILVLPPCPGL